jgi:hypothetical protein
MRRRKPCVLARRRLLGWKVRLLTVGSPGADRSGVHTSACPPTVRSRPVRLAETEHDTICSRRTRTGTRTSPPWAGDHLRVRTRGSPPKSGYHLADVTHRWATRRARQGPCRPSRLVTWRVAC